MLPAGGLRDAEGYAGLDAASALAGAEAAAPEERVLIVAREHLEMDLAYFTRFTSADEVVERLHGDGRSFGLRRGSRIRLADTYCQRVVDGRLPNVITDTQHDDWIASLAPTLGSYVGVPVRLGDGRIHGTLCCASHGPAPWLQDRDAEFMRVLAQILADDLEHGELVHDRDEEIAISALLAGLGARDSYTGRHSETVVRLAMRVTRELGMPAGCLGEVKQVAMLHDIGKIGIPDAILAKEGPLDEAEWDVMRKHPIIGAQIVGSIDALAHLAPAIRAGHERCDGQGYPDGLTHDQIPLSSRVTFACDAYDAMISSRPYRPEPMDRAAAAAELRDHAGTQFDPDVVDALLRVLDL
jgi:hypothetical protein